MENAKRRWMIERFSQPPGPDDWIFHSAQAHLFYCLGPWARKRLYRAINTHTSTMERRHLFGPWYLVRYARWRPVLPRRAAAPRTEG
jgi:hypothetical protein